MLKNALSDGPSVILRPLYNSNGAKVFIVKWSKIRLLVPEVLFMAYLKMAGIPALHATFKSSGETTCHTNQILRPKTIDTFATLLL